MEPKKKMTLMQLTVIVAVNMMGSGIIMLPANMAKVGAISLLSWGVTALGSMAIAYGFAQAGLFNQRPGGMSAYAEDAHGKAGFFMTFYLYFFSLAIGNVAIAISAVGYLATFFPWLSSTPVATCIGVIGLVWLTTVANFGGPRVTGRIGSVTVWGVILPVGLLSIIGWFWFSGHTFAAAWNPQGIGIAKGLGSSVALTLWAFLGMESAAQNSSAVEVDRPVRLGLRQDVQPDGRINRHGVGCDGLFGLASGVAVHDLTNRKVGSGRPDVPLHFLESEQHGRSCSGNDRHGSRPMRDGSVHDLTKPQ